MVRVLEMQGLSRWAKGLTGWLLCLLRRSFCARFDGRSAVGLSLGLLMVLLVCQMVESCQCNGRSLSGCYGPGVVVARTGLVVPNMA